MNEHKFEVEGGKSLRLKTAGKYCDRDIVVEGKKAESRNLPELLYTEGAEITPDMFGDLELHANSILANTKCGKLTLPTGFTKVWGLINNTHLREYNGVDVATIMAYAFQNCSNLETINFPNATNIYTFTFEGCSNLGDVYLPNITNIQAKAAFSNAGKKGSKLILPKINSLAQWNFNNSGKGFNFSLLDIGADCASLGNQLFGGCPNLEAVIVRKSDSVCTSAGVIQTTTGYPNKTFIAYVPALTDTGEDMVALYQAATNWTVIADRIKPFYIAETVEDITTLLADDNIAEGSMIICDANHSYTIKGGKTF